MSKSNSVNKTVKHALEELGRLRDEARLELHLLGMDARRLWNDLEARAEGLEEDLASKGEKAAEASLAAVDELVTSIRDFVESNASEPSGGTLTAGAVMSETARSCSPSDRLSDAARILWEADCGALPVVDAEGRVVGMVTDRDLCMAAYTKALPLHEIRVDQVMSTGVVTCRQGDSVDSILERLATRQVRRLPVVDEGSRLLGLVSIADLALHAVEVESNSLLVRIARTTAVLSTPRPRT